MNKTLQTVLGFVLVAAGVYAFIQLPDRGEWASVVLIGFGGFFVSQSKVSAALKAAAGFLKDIGWKR